MESRIFYWERQGRQHTCGIHTLNSILQGPFITKDIFHAKALEVKQEQLKIAPDLDESIIDDDGCSVELLQKCLADHQIKCQYLRMQEIGEILKYKGMICNNGDHYFALINYERCWINFDSLSSNGPEFLVIEELCELIATQLGKGGVFFQLTGDLPKNYDFPHDLMEHQRVFSFNDIYECGSIIKAIRESQRPTSVKNLSEEEQIQLALKRSQECPENNSIFNGLPSEAEQMELIRAGVLDDFDGNLNELNKFLEDNEKMSFESESSENEELKLAKQMSIDENKHLFIKEHPVFLIKQNGRVLLESVKESESFQEFEERLKEKLGYSQVEIFMKDENFSQYPEKTSKVLDFVNICLPIKFYVETLI